MEEEWTISSQNSLVKSIVGIISEIIAYAEFKDQTIVVNKKVEINLTGNETIGECRVLFKLLQLFFASASIYSSLFYDPIGIDIVAHSSKQVIVRFINKNSSILPKFLEKLINLFLYTKKDTVRDQKIRILIAERMCEVNRLVPPSVLHNISGNPLGSKDIESFYRDMKSQKIETDMKIGGFSDFFCYVAQYTEDYEKFMDGDIRDFDEILRFQRQWRFNHPIKNWADLFRDVKGTNLSICFLSYPGRTRGKLKQLINALNCRTESIEFPFEEFIDQGDAAKPLRAAKLLEFYDKKPKIYEEYDIVAAFNQNNTKIIFPRLKDQSELLLPELKYRNKTIDYIVHFLIILQAKIQRYLPDEKIVFCCKNSMNGGVLDFLRSRGLSVLRIGPEGVGDFISRFMHNRSSTFFCMYKFGRLCLSFSDPLLDLMKTNDENIKSGDPLTSGIEDKDKWFFSLYKIEMQLRNSSAIDIFSIYLIAIAETLQDSKYRNIEIPPHHPIELYKCRSMKLPHSINEKFILDASGETILEPKGAQKRFDEILNSFDSNEKVRAIVLTQKHKDYAKLYAEAADNETLCKLISKVRDVLRDYELPAESIF
ncbi:MAG: hypothetical protein MHMPM18_001690 [Marteilia pararefringens]